MPNRSQRTWKFYEGNLRHKRQVGQTYEGNSVILIRFLLPRVSCPQVGSGGSESLSSLSLFYRISDQNPAGKLVNLPHFISAGEKFPAAMAHALHFSISLSPPPPPFLSKRLSSKPYACSAGSPISSVHSVSPVSENRLPLSKAPAPVVLQPTTVDSGVMHLDVAMEVELRENGPRSSRRTKLVCTIGPATCGLDELEALAAGGMNVARLNMCHATREWHRTVIERVRWLNQVKGFSVSIMMDTEGSEVHMGDLGGLTSAKAEVLVNQIILFLTVIMNNFNTNPSVRLLRKCEENKDKLRGWVLKFSHIHLYYQLDETEFSCC